MTTMTTALKVHVLKQFSSKNSFAKFFFSYTLPIKKYYAHSSDKKFQEGKKNHKTAKSRVRTEHQCKA